MSLPWSRDMQLDPGTFGGSPACHVLVDMMNKNVIPVQEKHRVLSFISGTILHFKAISAIKERGIRARVMVLLKNDLFSRIDQMPYPAHFNSYLKNVVNHHFRRYLKEVV